jgi:tripartite ATP-independent transporter DctP family solute receptor
MKTYRNIPIGLIGVSLLLTLVLVCNSNSLGAEKKPIVIRLTHTGSQPMSQQATFFEKCVKEKSNGMVVIEIYPMGQLFSGRDAFPAVRKGAVEMGSISVGMIQGAIPLLEFLDLPFLFRDYDDVKRSWHGYPSEILKQEFEKEGMKFLAPGYPGFSVISNSKREIRSPEDMKGLKFRTLGPMSSDVIIAMGGAPVVTGGEEAYLMLSRKVVDGALTNASSMAARKYWEIQKYLTLVNVYFPECPMFMNLEFWKGLSNEVQNLLQECAKISEEYVFSLSIQLQIDGVKTMANNGMKVYTPTPAELAEFRKIAGPLKEAWVKKHGEVAAKMVEFVESLK